MTSSLDRVFLGWDGPALALAAHRLADAYAAGESLDMQAAVVALPGARPGRRLKELLLDEAERRALRLVPPRVVTIGSVAELLYQPERPLIDSHTARRFWAEALRRADRDAVLAPLFADIPTQDDVRGWDRLAAEVQRIHAEVAPGGHRFGDVARKCEDDALFDDGARWHALARVEERYAQLLEEAGRADANLARIRALAGKLAFDGDLWLVGVAEMPPVVRRMLRSAKARIHVLVHAPEEEADAFDDLGCVVPSAWLRRRLDIPDDELRIADRPADQADAVLAEIAELPEDHTTDDVSIAVPDADLVPYLEQRLEAWGIPARYAAGTAISRSPTYTFLAAAADYLKSGRQWKPFAALIRHPHLEAHLDGIDAGSLAVEADRFFCDRLPATVPDDLSIRWTNLRAARAAVDQLLRPLQGRRPLSAWGGVLLGILADLYDGITLDRGRRRDRRLIETLSTFREAARSLSTTPPLVDAECAGTDAVELLLAAVRSVAVPEEPERAAVELLGWLEMHLDDAPVAFVTGFNEQHLPESLSADAFLPDRLRTRLGLLNNETRYARDAYYLTAIRHSRERVRWIAGRMTADGDPLRPSRLMLAVEGEALARRALLFTTPNGRGPAVVLPARRRAAAKSAFMLPPERELAFEPPAELRVTAFRDLLQNPYLFALNARYRLEGIDDAAREMDGGIFGTVAHEVLREFGRSERRNSSAVREVRECLDELLDTYVRRQFGESRALPAVTLQVELLRLRLRALAEWQARWAEEGWNIVLVEGCPVEDVKADDRTCRVAYDVDELPITLTGRIDRIDRNAVTGDWAILDYKTGDKGELPEKTHRKGRAPNKEWIDLQLPLYRHLVSLPGPAGEAPILPDLDLARLRLGYVLLPRALDGVGDALADWTPEDLESADDVAREAIRRLREGRATFDAAAVGRFYDTGMAALFGTRQLVPASTDDDEEEDE